MLSLLVLVINLNLNRKFPSYFRRAAIADAIGIVSSFQTRYREWQSGIRKYRKVRPPRLTAMCQSYPALYKGQQVKYNKVSREIIEFRETSI